MDDPVISLNAFNVSWLAIYVTFAVLIVRHWKSQSSSTPHPATFVFLLTSAGKQVAANWRTFVAILVLLVALHIALEFATFWMVDWEAASVPQSYPSQALAIHWIGDVLRFLLSATLGLFWLRANSPTAPMPIRAASILVYLVVFYVIFDLSLIIFGWFVWTIPTMALAIMTGEGFMTGRDSHPILMIASAAGGALLAVILSQFAHLVVALPATLQAHAARIPGIVKRAKPFAIPLAVLLVSSWAFVRLSDAVFSYVEMQGVFNGFPINSGGGAFAGGEDGLDYSATLVGMAPRALVRALLFLFALSLFQSAYQAARTRSQLATAKPRTPPG